MLFSVNEIIDMIVLTLAIGYIFSDYLSQYNQKGKTHSYRTSSTYDPVKDYTQNRKKVGPFNVNIDDMKFAMAVIAPAIILHEFGHKFVAMSYGLDATFHTAYMWLALAVGLKMMGSRFLFIVPAFVSYPMGAAPFERSLIAFAGPAINFALFGIAWFLLKTNDKLKPQTRAILVLTQRVNLILGLFNMIPIRPFDGGHVFQGIFQSIGSLI